ncbi:MAG TPA: sulfatase-like hydrolase/transferase, partial [Acidimicrobiia bacterium]|nr:sulfatase-like hydrolase/transferase [Acidimicrobiia bacterium]
TNAYSQHSVCAQSRISMFTGWYPHVAGHRTLEHLLAAHEPNVFARLRESGYHVALAGTRGDMFAAGGTRAVSDRFGFTVPPKLEDLGKWHASPFEPGSKWYDAFYGGPVDGDLYEFDAATVRTAAEWLAERLPEPWCLFVALVFPHPPFTVERRWYDLYDGVTMPAPVPTNFDGKPGFYREIHRRYGLDRMTVDDWAEITRTYYAMVTRVDDQLREVRDALARSGQAENTVTFFFTDHGEYLGDYGLVEKWPSGVDDVLVRNPLIVHDPSGRAGAASSFVEMVDLTATLEDLAGLERGAHFGRTVRTLLADPTAPHRDAAFSEGGFLVQEEPLLEAGDTGQYRHKQEIQHDRTELVGRAIAVRTEDWCYVERLYEGPELYDRRTDPLETTNLAGRPEHAATQRDLRDRIFRWLFETSDVIPTRRDPRFDDDLRQALFGG